MGNGNFVFIPDQDMLDRHNLVSKVQTVWLCNGICSAVFGHGEPKDINLRKGTPAGLIYCSKYSATICNISEAGPEDSDDEPFEDDEKEDPVPSWRRVHLTSELGNSISIPLRNENLTEQDVKKIQAAMQPYGHVFATCAQESKLVRNF